MSNFAYIWGSSAAIATGTSITQAALWQLDQNQKSALNADGGGTWAPSATINFGGSFGLVLANPFYLTVGGTSTLAVVNTSGLVTCNNGLTIATAGALTCSRAANLSGLVSCTNGLSVSTAGQFTCSRYANFTDEVQCDGNVTLGSDTADTLTVNATETHEGPETHNGVETHNGAVTCEDDFSCNGITQLAATAITGLVSLAVGSQLLKRVKWLVDASATVLCTEYDEVIVSGLTSTGETLELLLTGAVENSSILVVNKTAATNYITVFASGGFSHVLGAMYATVFVYHSAAWQKKYGFSVA
jgi:hypothetical protein